MAEKKKARGIKVVAASVAMVVVGSGAAFAATIPGTDAGEALHGTRQVDKIYGYAGADLLTATPSRTPSTGATRPAGATGSWAAPVATG